MFNPSQQQLTFLAGTGLYSLAGNYLIMTETHFFSGTDLVYDLPGQWKFFAMEAFVNWAEI